MKALLALCYLLPACMTVGADTFDFRQFKTATYSVLNETELGASEAERAYADKVVLEIDHLLAQRLPFAGLSLSQNADLVIEVKMVAIKSGNALLRGTIGFGTGRAVTLFDVSFRTRDGSLLAVYRGGKAYSVLRPFPGEKRESLEARHAVAQIDAYIANNGRFPPNRE